VVVTDADKKAALIPLAYNQKHAGENSVLLVLAARTDVDESFIAEFTTRIETTRGLPAGSADGYKTVMVNDLMNRTPEARLAWAKEQAYIALGTMMAAASELRVDNHAMTGFDPVGFNNALGLNEKNLYATVLLTLGYRDSDDEWQNYAKVRRTAADMVVRM
jgi:nitroreductase